MADREAVHPVVIGQPLAGPGVDDRTRPHADACAEKCAGVAGGDEADVMRIRLGGHRQSPLRRLGTDRGFGRVADREHRAVELVPGEHGQDVGLVLVRIDGPTQLSSGQARVVAGGQRIETQGHRLVGQRREFDLLVAGQTRIRGLSRSVGGDELVDDVVLEAIGEVPHVERDPQDVGGAAGIVGIFTRTAPPRAGA